MENRNGDFRTGATAFKEKKKKETTPPYKVGRKNYKDVWMFFSW